MDDASSLPNTTHVAEDSHGTDVFALSEHSSGNSCCSDCPSVEFDSEASDYYHDQVGIMPPSGGPYRDECMRTGTWRLMTANVTSLRQQYD